VELSRGRGKKGGKSGVTHKEFRGRDQSFRERTAKKSDLGSGREGGGGIEWVTENRERESSFRLWGIRGKPGIIVKGMARGRIGTREREKKTVSANRGLIRKLAAETGDKLGS